MKKMLLFLVAVVFFVLGAGLVYSVYFVKSSVSSIIIPNTFKTEPFDAMERHFVDKSPFNFVLIGYGGGTHDGTYLTDSIMVVHIDPKNQATTLISIPRDIWTKIPSDTSSGLYAKINYAYQVGLDDTNFANKSAEYKGTSGGGNLVKYVVGQVVGLPLDNFVGMDFSGFQKTIDSLDGVDIAVNPAFDDYQYPIEGKETDPCGHNDTEIASLSAQLASKSATISELDAFPCRYKDLHFNQGLQHMDGSTALSYVRSRHSLQDGTDFGRAKRQRNLITAVKQKIFSVNLISHIIPFMESLKDDVRTDLSLSDIQDLVKHAQEVNGYTIHTLALTDQNYLSDAVSSDGQDILQPKAGLDNWSEVHAWIQKEIDPSFAISHPIVQIENGSGIAGLGEDAANKLRRISDITVLPVLNADSKDHKATTIQVYGKVSSSVLQKLEKGLSVSSWQQIKGDTQGQYDVLVVLGADYNKIN